MASFNTAAFPDSLAIAREESMTIGTIDEIQKLHIRSVPLGEQPRRVAHQPATRSFAVVTTRAAILTGRSGAAPRSAAARLLEPPRPASGSSLAGQPGALAQAATLLILTITIAITITTSLTAMLCPTATDEACTDAVRLVDDTTFETLDRHALGPYEMACSVASMSLGDDAAAHYVVGTAYAVPEEPEPSKVGGWVGPQGFVRVLFKHTLGALGLWDWGGQMPDGCQIALAPSCQVCAAESSETHAPA